MFKPTIKLNSDSTSESYFYKQAGEGINSLNKSEVATLLRDSDTFAFTLLTICAIAYGNTTFIVDPLVLYQNLKDDFDAELSEDNQNKLSAILACLTTNYFFKDLSVFKSVCQTLSDGDPGIFDPGFDDPTVVEVIWGMYEVSLAYDDSQEEYAPEIKAFVEKALATDPEDTELSGLTAEESYQSVIAENVVEMKRQLLAIGVKDIPKFPAIEI